MIGAKSSGNRLIGVISRNLCIYCPFPLHFILYVRLMMKPQDLYLNLGTYDVYALRIIAVLEANDVYVLDCAQG